MNKFDENDQWLDDLLSEPPIVSEGDFSGQVLRRLQRLKRQRYLILGTAWLAAVLLALVFSPWLTLIQTWRHSLTSFVAPVVNTSGEYSLQWPALVEWASQSHVAPLLAVGLLSLVCLLQWLLQDD